MKDDDPLFNITTKNDKLKNQIAALLANLDSMKIEEAEDQVAELIINMMNFFSGYVDEIPKFDSLSEQKKNLLLKRFKAVTKNLKSSKTQIINEAIQIFVFTILNNIGINKEEVSKLSFNDLISKAATYEIYHKIEEDKPKIAVQQGIKTQQAIIHQKGM
jgi:hypothetical protein